MVADHHCTLLIIPVGQGVFLVSLSPSYFKAIDVLTAELAVSQGRASGFNEAENPIAKVALTKQRAEITQRFESLL